MLDCTKGLESLSITLSPRDIARRINHRSAFIAASSECSSAFIFISRLEIDGKPLKVHEEYMKRALKTWQFTSKDGTMHMVVLGAYHELLH